MLRSNNDLRWNLWLSFFSFGVSLGINEFYKHGNRDDLTFSFSLMSHDFTEWQNLGKVARFLPLNDNLLSTLTIFNVKPLTVWLKALCNGSMHGISTLPEKHFIKAWALSPTSVALFSKEDQLFQWNNKYMRQREFLDLFPFLFSYVIVLFSFVFFYPKEWSASQYSSNQAINYSCTILGILHINFFWCFFYLCGGF